MWTKKEVADYLKVTVRQIDILRERHGLPFVKIGGVIRFRIEDVEKWLNSQAVN